MDRNPITTLPSFVSGRKWPGGKGRRVIVKDIVSGVIDGFDSVDAKLIYSPFTGFSSKLFTGSNDEDKTKGFSTVDQEGNVIAAAVRPTTGATKLDSVLAGLKLPSLGNSPLSVDTSYKDAIMDLANKSTSSIADLGKNFVKTKAQKALNDLSTNPALLPKTKALKDAEKILTQTPNGGGAISIGNIPVNKYVQWAVIGVVVIALVTIFIKLRS